MNYLSLCFAFLLLASPVSADEQAELSSDDILQVIHYFSSDPLSERSDAFVSAFFEYAEASEDVQINVSVHLYNWLTREPEVKYESKLFAAGIAGNLRSQLESGVTGNDDYSGLLLLFRVYNHLKSVDADFEVAEIEEQLEAHRRGELRNYIAQRTAPRADAADAADAAAPDADADGPARRDEPLNLTFPRSLGGVGFVNAKDYDHPALGYSLRYDNFAGMKIDVYVYDKEFPEIPSGHRDPAISEELASAEAAVRHFEREGDYLDVKKIDEGVYPADAGPGQWAYQSSRFRFRQAGGPGVASTEPRISETYLCGFKDHFVKVRVTYFSDTAEESVPQRQRFMDDLSALLAGSQ